MGIGLVAIQDREVSFREGLATNPIHQSLPHQLKIYQRTTDRQAISRLISELDPLRVDEAIKQLPQYNKNKDVSALKRLLAQMLPTINEVSTYSYSEAAAALRDIGFLLGSLKRHGLEPAQELPQIEAVLFFLGKKLNMPPRDTLISYTIWNPTGARERTYTELTDEFHLIKSIRNSMFQLEEAIYDLIQLHQTSPFSLEFSNLCEQAMRHFKPMIDSIVYAKKNVSPKAFAMELRHYFDEISLRGKKYLGPGAVEMPMFVFEHLLWSCDNTEPKYKKFKEGYISYIFPELRKIYHDFENEKSLMSKIQNIIEAHHKENTHLNNSARNLLRLCNMIRSFRLPHKQLANNAYQGDLTQRDHGSGGYGVETLSHIDQLMQQTVKEMKESFKSKFACPVAH